MGNDDQRAWRARISDGSNGLLKPGVGGVSRLGAIDDGARLAKQPLDALVEQVSGIERDNTTFVLVEPRLCRVRQAEVTRDDPAGFDGLRLQARHDSYWIELGQSFGQLCC